MERHLKHLFLSAVLGLLLFACNTPAAPVAPTEAVSSDSGLFPGDEVVSTNPPNPTPTNITLGPISTQDLALSINRPSHQQLNDYLFSFLVPMTEPPYSPRDVREVYYLDLNEDTIDELIVDSGSYVAIMFWDGEKISEPFIFDMHGTLNSRSYFHNSIVGFEDWTNDGNMEVISKVRTEFSATPFGGSSASYRIISCDLETCQLALQIDNSHYFEDILNGGESLEQTAYTLFVNEEGKAAVRTLRTGHWFNCCGGFESGQSPELSQEELLDELRSFHVAESLVRTYVWNGEVFELSTEEIAALGYTLAPTSQFDANNVQGIPASLSITNSSDFIGPNVDDQCQLVIDGNSVDDPFQCERKYTNIDWMDYNQAE